MTFFHLPSKRSVVRPEKLAIFLFAVGAALDILEAYDIFGVPIPWIAIVFYFSAFLIPLMSDRKVPYPQGTNWLALYLFWSLLALALHASINGFPAMPVRATTPYGVYVILRALTVFSFFFVLVVVYWLVKRGAVISILRVCTWLLFFGSVSAIYVYFAQIFGFWEPPRNRMGTGGQDFVSEGVHFTYAFHRALGTFREPSHLGEWLSSSLVLLLPVIFKLSGLWLGMGVIILVSIALLLTGSLLGILCLFTGLTILAILSGQMRFRAVLLAFVSLLLFFATFVYGIFGIDIIGTLAPRMQELLEGGVKATNRAYVYENIELVPIGLIGYGLGTAPLIIAQVTGSDLVVSVLNLFLSAAYDAGIIGVISYVMFFIAPVALTLRYRLARDPLISGCLASHAAWIVSYIGRAAEINPAHAISMGIVLAVVYMRRNQLLDRHSDLYSCS